MSRIYLSQTKFTITLDAGSSLVGVSTALIKYKKPDGTLGSWSGTVATPADGLVTYSVTGTDELDQVGNWIVWLDITFSDTGNLLGVPSQFKVYAPIT
tara:strand:+ start:7005 stop:7298 length:294 start_codon:yes stop_codon:yes gene_type:complete